MNLFNLFSLNENSGKVLLHLPNGTEITYSQAYIRIKQFYNAFITLGLKPGDRIIQSTEKNPDNLFVYLASLCYGTIYIPLNPAFTKTELQYYIDDADPALLICDFEKEAETKSLNLNCQVFSLSPKGSGSLQEVLPVSNLNEITISPKKENDIACILYTSGTTGKPKGAMLSHKNLATNAKALINHWNITYRDKLLHCLPLFHCHGLFFACNTLLIAGAEIIFIDKFSITDVMDTLPQATIMMGVPTYYTRLLAAEKFNSYPFKTTRLFISGSAPLLGKTFHDFQDKTGHYILERYGMTETGIIASNPLDSERRCGTVGKPLLGTEVKIIDNENNECASNQVGQILVKGDSVFSGYWRNLSKTKESFTQDDFFKTGDLGILDSDGYLTIVGRAKDLIITGGMNVYPKEVEIELNKIPEIKESAVIGLPHTDFGEAVSAVVVTLEPIDEDMILKVLKKTLASYKIPKKIFFTPTLPRNAMGKIQKTHLRKQFHIE